MIVMYYPRYKYVLCSPPTSSCRKLIILVCVNIILEKRTLISFYTVEPLESSQRLYVLMCL